MPYFPVFRFNARQSLWFILSSSNKSSPRSSKVKDFGLVISPFSSWVWFLIILISKMFLFLFSSSIFCEKDLDVPPLRHCLQATLMLQFPSQETWILVEKHQHQDRHGGGVENFSQESDNSPFSHFTLSDKKVKIWNLQCLKKRSASCPGKFNPI